MALWQAHPELLHLLQVQGRLRCRRIRGLHRSSSSHRQAAAAPVLCGDNHETTTGIAVSSCNFVLVHRIAAEACGCAPSAQAWGLPCPWLCSSWEACCKLLSHMATAILCEQPARCCSKKGMPIYAAAGSKVMTTGQSPVRWRLVCACLYN